MRTYNNDIYKMYEEQFNQNEKKDLIIKDLKLEIANLKYELDYFKKSHEKKVISEVKKVEEPLKKENIELKLKSKKEEEEITRLMKELENCKEELEKCKAELEKYREDKDYLIDKLTNQVNKDSTNSSIPTSKEIKHPKKEKTGANLYNLREKTNLKTGGQPNHKGTTLTKEKIEEKIKNNNVPVKEIIHYVKGKSKKEIVKYVVDVKLTPIVEKHIFIYKEDATEELPKEFYSNVTYGKDIKTMITALGNCYSLSYQNITDFFSTFTNGFINLSQGTIDNTYTELSDKAEATLNNIVTDLINAPYLHTDETTTNANGKETYYRGYANPKSVLYKFHDCKGDKPIIEDNILNNYFGTIISDHEPGIFKYGINNQDCIVHIGRYCNEQTQNVMVITWPKIIFSFLLKLERERKILSKFGRTEFIKEEIKNIEQEYDDILELAAKQNEEINSSYWKDKANALLKRLKKYKNSVLFYIHDFTIPYDNNFMERALRMIKGKTKVSGGFRSREGAIRFGNIMSVIKTARLRNLNPITCIKSIFEGKTLFA